MSDFGEAMNRVSSGVITWFTSPQTVVKNTVKTPNAAIAESVHDVVDTTTGVIFDAAEQTLTRAGDIAGKTAAATLSPLIPILLLAFVAFLVYAKWGKK